MLAVPEPQSIRSDAYLIKLLILLFENVEDILIDLRIVIRGGHVAQYSPFDVACCGVFQAKRKTEASYTVIRCQTRLLV